MLNNIYFAEENETSRDSMIFAFQKTLLVTGQEKSCHTSSSQTSISNSVYRRLRDLNQRQEGVKAELNTSRELVCSLEEDNKRLYYDNVDLIRELDAAKQQVRTFRDEHAIITRGAVESNLKLQKERAKFREASEQISELLFENDLLCEKADATDYVRADLEQHNMSLQSSVKAKDAELQRGKDELFEAQTTVARLREEVIAIMPVKVAQEEQLAETQSENIELKAQIASLMSDNRKLRNRVSACDARIVCLELAIAQETVSKNKNDKMLSEMHGICAALTRENRQAQERSSVLEEKLAAERKTSIIVKVAKAGLDNSIVVVKVLAHIFSPFEFQVPTDII